MNFLNRSRSEPLHRAGARGVRHLVAMGAFALLASSAFSQGLSPVGVKQVAAPPSDILSGRLTLPDAGATALVSTSALLPVQIQAGGVFTLDLPVTARGARIAILPAQQGDWTIQVVDPEGGVALSGPDGSLVQPAEMRQQMRQQVRHSFSELPWSAPGRVFDQLDIDAVGDWSISIESKNNTEGYVLVDAGPNAALRSGLTSRQNLVRSPVSLTADFDPGVTMTALHAIVRSPDGTLNRVAGDINRGIVEFEPGKIGDYAVHVLASGENAQGDPVVLTAQHVVAIDSASPDLGEPRALVAADNDRVEFVFEDDPSNRRTILAAEVWAKTDQGDVPVCWLSRVCDGDRSLALDTRWIAMAGVDPASLELREVRLHDVDSMVLLERRASVAIGAVEIDLPPAPESIQPSMLQGTPGRTVLSPVSVGINAAPAARGAASGHRLLLSHGYCSGGNPFPTSQFTGDLSIFSDPNQSRSNDEFALRILAQTQNIKSFGAVAHSQGGLASAHLFTFYWSGLDWSRGDRLIQSVGSPYQGTALAGSAAVLGDIFGAGCGSNTDLSYDGAAVWLSLIPTSVRQNVWYWTTSAPSGLFSWCEFATSLLLSAPEDGVVERTAGQLPGANNMGHLEGWCHTSGMNDPPQTSDINRNTEMNMRARR